MPPVHICIVGSLAIAAGVGSIFGMLSELIGGSFTFDFGFVGIPIGYGIFAGKRTSRKLAIVFAAIGAVVVLGSGAWVLYARLSGGDKMSYPDAEYAAAELVVWSACCIYILVVLCQRSSRGWFEQSAEHPLRSKSFASAVVVTTAVLHFSHHAAEWWMKQTLDQIFQLNVTVVPYSATSGESLGELSFSGDAFSFGHSKPPLPKVDVFVSSGRDGMQLVFSGIASRPVDVTITSEGFEDTPLTLDENSKDVIRVAMQPVAASEPDPAAEEERRE